MDYTPDCKLQLEPNNNGGVKYAKCACGEFLGFSISGFASNRHAEKQRFERLHADHCLRKILPRSDDEV